MQEGEACEEMLRYFIQLRSDNVPALDSLPGQFAAVQRRVLEVVECRKDLEKARDISALVSAHSQSLKALIQASHDREGLLSQSSMQTQTLIEERVQHRTDTFLRLHQLLAAHTPNRAETVPPYYQQDLECYRQALKALTEGTRGESCWEVEGLGSLLEEHKQGIRLAKLAWEWKWEAVCLKEELLEERTRHLQEYARSSNLLTDTIISMGTSKVDPEWLPELLNQQKYMIEQLEKYQASGAGLASHYEIEIQKSHHMLRSAQQSLAHSEKENLNLTSLNHLLHGEKLQLMSRVSQLDLAVGAMSRQIEQMSRQIAQMSRQIEQMSRQIEQMRQKQSYSAEEQAGWRSECAQRLAKTEREIQELKQLLVAQQQSYSSLEHQYAEAKLLFQKQHTQMVHALEETKALLIQRVHAEAQAQQSRKEFSKEWEMECQSLRRAVQVQLNAGRDQRANILEALIGAFAKPTDI